MPLKVRRVVTGHDSQGRAVVLSDGLPPQCGEDPEVKVGIAELWATSEYPVSNEGNKERPFQVHCRSRQGTGVRSFALSNFRRSRRNPQTQRRCKTICGIRVRSHQSGHGIQVCIRHIRLITRLSFQAGLICCLTNRK